MVKLQIKKGDGSSYWTEIFETNVAAEKWLDEEKTRKYWSESFTYEVIDLDPFDPIKEQKKIDDLVKKQQIEQKKQERIDTLKVLDWSTVKTIADIKPILKMLVEDFLKDQD